VLLLEAGGKDSNPWIHIPLGYARTFVNPRVNWMFDSEPEPNLNNRLMYQPRGGDWWRSTTKSASRHTR